MICKNCNQTYDDNAVKCPYCGVPKEPSAEQYSQQQRVQQEFANPQTGYYAPPVDPAAKGKGTGALVCGIVGIVMGFLIPIVGIILGILGIVLGSMAKRDLPEGQKGMATGGLICGTIAIVLSIIMWIASAVLLMAVVNSLY